MNFRMKNHVNRQLVLTAMGMLLIGTSMYAAAALPVCFWADDGRYGSGGRYAKLETLGTPEQVYSADQGSTYGTTSGYYMDPVRVYCEDAADGTQYAPDEVNLVCSKSEVHCQQCSNFHEQPGLFYECMTGVIDTASGRAGSSSVQKIVCGSGTSNPALSLSSNCE